MPFKRTEQTKHGLIHEDDDALLLKRFLARKRCGYRNNTKINLRGIGYEDVHWIELLK
jgi:hypothetical protein